MKIEKCPFCGGEARIKSRYIGYGSVGLGARDWYTVECNECRAKSDEYGAELEAIAAWNRRTDVAPVVRGEWIVTDAYPHRVYCSLCYKTNVLNEEWLYEKNDYPKYCMWCGAKMESEGST